MTHQPDSPTHPTTPTGTGPRTRRRLQPAGRRHRVRPGRTRGRRTFLRYGTAAALSVVAAGAGTILNPRRALAGPGAGCCALVNPSTPWCKYHCIEAGAQYLCWTCNNMNCICCECIDRPQASTCYFATLAPIPCSDHVGCCDE